MPTALMLSVSHGSLPLSNVSLPPWKEVKNRIDGATPSVYADFGRDKYALANVGPNLVANGDFKTGLSNWTVVSGTASASGGVCRISGDGSGGRILYALTGLVVGRVYALTFDTVGLNGTNLAYAISPNTSSTSANADATAVTSATGAKQFLFVATATTRNILFALVTNTLGTYADVANVIVREVTSTLGPNLVRNGNFDADLAGWTDASTAPSSMSWSGGQAVTVTDGVNLARIRQTITTVPGRTYAMYSTGNTGIGVGTSAGGQEILALRSALSRAFVATAATTYLSVATANNGQTLDNVSVREVLVGLGPELVTNGEFTIDLSGWSIASSTAPSTVIWSNGVAQAQTDGVNAARLRQSVPTVAGRTYVFTAAPAFGTTGMSVALGTTAGGTDIAAAATVAATTTTTFVAPGTAVWISCISAIDGRTLDFVSVREVLTNQPLQPVTPNELLSVSSGAKTVVANDNTLKTIPANYPAFDYRSGKRQLLLEGAATNLITQSVALNLWTANGTTVTTGELSSDGVNNWRVVTDASTSVVGNINASRSVTASTASYLYSMRLKKDPSATNNMQLVVIFSGGTTQDCRAVFDPRTGAVGATFGCTSGVIDYGSECRIWMVVTNNGTNTSITNYLMPATNSAGSGGYSQSVTQTGSVTVCHAQLEVGTYPSSYILTAGSQVTRVTDVCAFSPLLNLCIPQMAATMAYRANIRSAISSQVMIGIVGGFQLIRGSGAGTALSLDGNTSAITVFVEGTLPGTVGAAFGWDSSGRALAVNGSAIVSDTRVQDRQMPPFYFGASAGQFAGAVQEIGAFVVWPLKGTNFNIQQQARAYA